jgi:hypothetical protein
MIRGFLLTSMCLALTACGGDDDGSGVDADKPFSEATVDDAQALCEYTEGLIDPEVSQKIQCYAEGIFGEQQEQGDCQTIVDDCLAEPLEEEPSECGQIDDEDVADLPECASEVTFGEYEDCVDAVAVRSVELADDISCETSLEDLLDEGLPQACAHIEEVCPDLLDG